ncbi:hypothetical protein AB0D78_28420 [Streptomyces avermitilis]|uniref:hypothetical protein n=1 Tax=Streptomyces avermitilis TaxID=33903 RepID=UPI0033E33D00
MTDLYRLTPQTLGDILESEPKAVAVFDDDMRVTGVELPLPDGMAYADGGRTKTALFGDRVGQDRYGHWLVFPAPPQ